ncbi:terminase small subunit [Escherichia coli]
MKNARDSAEVGETAFYTFVLSRIAGEIAVATRRDPCRCSGVFGTGKPTC